MQKTFAPLLQQVSSAQETHQINQRTKKYDKPHMIIPGEDMAWAVLQRPPVYKLWGECWRSDPYGSRWMPLVTSLGRENFKKAKRPLIESGLFLFESRLTIVDGQRCYEWWVKNLHGCRSAYWKLKGVEVGTLDHTQDEEETGNTSMGTVDAEVGTQSTEIGTESTAQKQGDIGNTGIGAGDNDMGTNSTEAGTLDTEVGAISTTQPYLNSLRERVSKTLINISVTLHKHFSNSLTIRERGEFLNFCLEKIKRLDLKGIEVHTDHSWIASHYEQYWKEFCNEQRLITASANDWAAHPQLEEWLDKIRTLGFGAFIYEDGDRSEDRYQFYKWADSKNLIWGQEV